MGPDQVSYYLLPPQSFPSRYPRTPRWSIHHQCDSERYCQVDCCMWGMFTLILSLTRKSTRWLTLICSRTCVSEETTWMRSKKCPDARSLSSNSLVNGDQLWSGGAGLSWFRTTSCFKAKQEESCLMEPAPPTNRVLRRDATSAVLQRKWGSTLRRVHRAEAFVQRPCWGGGGEEGGLSRNRSGWWQLSEHGDGACPSWSEPEWSEESQWQVVIQWRGWQKLRRCWIADWTGVVEDL